MSEQAALLKYLQSRKDLSPVEIQRTGAWRRLMKLKRRERKRFKKMGNAGKYANMKLEFQQRSPAHFVPSVHY